jgi:post-segregation antitoxin (ccd killing protein)
MSRVEAAAQGRDLGDLFEYRLNEPVTIRKNQSALVPIINAQVGAERVSVWNASTGQRPRSAVWLTNRTAYTLDGGAVSVLEGGTFTGEGLIDPVKPGEKRLLSYAADLALLVDVKQDAAEPERVTSLRISRGVMVLQRELREKRTYTIRNEDKKARTVVIEHPNRAGWKLTSAVKPDETAPGAYRFRVDAPPQASATLAVEELRSLSATYTVTNVSDDQLALLVQQRALKPEAEQALRAIMVKKAEIAAVSGEISERKEESEQIFRDQERLRENLKALKGSAEERSLVGRYTRQLDEQETRLGVIRREIADRETKRARLQAELDALIQGLTVG